MSAIQNRVIIVGALDRTPASDWVVHTATSLASTLAGVELHFLHVVDFPGPVEGATSVSQRLQDAHAFMDRVVGDLASRISCKVAGHVASGSARQRILQLASDLDADLVVVGSHRKSAAGRWLLGSVSQAIVNDAPCAVLVARPKVSVVLPEIEPACKNCLEVQRASAGATLWCSQHATRHAHGKIHHMREVEPTGGSSVFIRT